jgi:hypothetical protein
MKGAADNRRAAQTLALGATLAAALGTASVQARTIFGNYGLDPSYCQQPTVRQTVVYIDDTMMLDGRVDWALKLDGKLKTTLAPGERVSVVRLSPASGQSREYWSGCWPGLSDAMRAAAKPSGMAETVEAMFSKSPEAELSDQRKYFLRDFGLALTRIYTEAKHPARPIEAAAPPTKQILRALASDYGRFLHSRQTVRAIVYSDFAENSDLGSAFKPNPAQEATYGQRLGTYLHGGVFYGFGEGEDVNGDPAFGETARAFWIAALRGLQGTVEDIGPDLNLGEALPSRARDYAITVDFDGQKLEGRLSLLTDPDGTLVDSWIGIARLGSAALTGGFRCAEQCRLEASTLGHLVTSDSPTEAVEMTGDPDALAGTIGVAGQDTLRSIKAKQADQ